MQNQELVDRRAPAGLAMTGGNPRGMTDLFSGSLRVVFDFEFLCVSAVNAFVFRCSYLGYIGGSTCSDVNS